MACFAALIPHLARADTYYVAADGDDRAGDGTSTRPWATIAYAANEGAGAEGGHVVLVRDGVYRGTSLITRSFPLTVTVRAEHPYGATLTGVDQGREAIRVYVVGPARLVLSGFVLTNHHPSYTCPDGREPNYVVHVQDASNVTIQNNIVFGNNAPGTCNELLKINRSRDDAYPKDIAVRGNVFYEPANAGGADMIDSVRAGEVDIEGNVFFSDPERDRSQSFITIKRQAPPPGPPRSPRFRVRGNVFLNWGGKADQAFVQFGEDGVPEHEITNAVVENNLFIGNAPARMAAPIQLKGVLGVKVRANTTVGDLPAGAFGLRIGTEGDNPIVGDVFVSNNIWVDPTGTMGPRFVNAYGDVDLDSIVLRRNLYWNAGTALPTDGSPVPADDRERIVSDPLLTTDHASMVLPYWDANAAAFASGATTISAEFMRLVNTYGALPADSPAVDAADPSDMPAIDIRGLLRDARPDIGAYELMGAATPTTVPSATHAPTPTHDPTLTRPPTPAHPATRTHAPTPDATSTSPGAPTLVPTPTGDPTTDTPVTHTVFLPLLFPAPRR